MTKKKTPIDYFLWGLAAVLLVLVLSPETLTVAHGDHIVNVPDVAYIDRDGGVIVDGTYSTGEGLYFVVVVDPAGTILTANPVNVANPGTWEKKIMFNPDGPGVYTVRLQDDYKPETVAIDSAVIEVREAPSESPF